MKNNYQNKLRKYLTAKYGKDYKERILKSFLVTSKQGFKAGYKTGIDENNWISIKDQPLPKDPLIKIIRWNKIHKCSVSVRYYPKHNKDMPWVTNDLSHCWPEESFLPYWKPECEAPPENNISFSIGNRNLKPFPDHFKC